MSLWNKMPYKDLDCEEWQKRLLFYDPTYLPTLFNAKPFQRHQPVSVYQLFPNVKGLCSCGCGVKLIGRQRRWATKECEKFAVGVRYIVYGELSTIQSSLRKYYGWNCSKCGCEDKGHDHGANGCVSWIKVDHIIPVKLGGGACWLSNYQLLCHDCHVGKTNKDFNWKKNKK